MKIAKSFVPCKYYLIKNEEMKKTQASKEVISLIQKRYKKIVEDGLKTLKEAFLMKAYDIDEMTISGKTLRKIFNEEYVHINTVKKLLGDFGKKWILKNGKIELENENNNSN